jgi:DNA-directed RNA polymerase alpha subunit
MSVGHAFGTHYRIDCLQTGRKRQLHLYASRFEVRDGHLILFKDEQPYRAFAPGNWQQIASISCLDGSEMYQKQDLVENPNDLSIEELELSHRSKNCLRSANIQTVGDLVKRTEIDLWKIQNFGRKSMNEIREVLSMLGLSLREASGAL